MISSYLNLQLLPELIEFGENSQSVIAAAVLKPDSVAKFELYFELGYVF